MLNHARTLLLNYKGPHTEDLNIPGDVYIPAFTPIVLPVELAQVHKILFGTAFDYLGLVHRASEYMGILHSTEYSAHVYTQDPRITYDPNHFTNMDTALFATVIRGQSGLHVNGTWPGAGSNGRIATLWRVRVLPNLTIKVDNITAGISATYLQSDVKTLIGSEFVCAIDDQELSAGNQWYVTNTARPKPEITEIFAQLKALPGNIPEVVFGNASVEPYKTFYNLYKDHYAFAYQFSGYLLAFIQRVEDLRTHVV